MPVPSTHTHTHCMHPSLQKPLRANLTHYLSLSLTNTHTHTYSACIPPYRKHSGQTSLTISLSHTHTHTHTHTQIGIHTQARYNLQPMSNDICVDKFIALLTSAPAVSHTDGGIFPSLY